MTKDVLSAKLEKFYFTTNIFDDDFVEEIVPEEPPPPVFSQEELEAAKKQAFEAGRKQGTEEQKNGQDALAVKTLESVLAQTSSLFEQEKQREKLFEQSSLRLTLKIFGSLFPLYQERLGLEELKNTITTVLKKQQGQKHVSLYVHPDAVEGVANHIAAFSGGAGAAFEVLPDETLPASGCKMLWKEGGALLDPAKTANEIRSRIEQVLAASGANVHDEDEGAAQNTQEQTEAKETEDQPESRIPEEPAPNTENLKTGGGETMEKQDE